MLIRLAGKTKENDGFDSRVEENNFQISCKGQHVLQYRVGLTIDSYISEICSDLLKNMIIELCLSHRVKWSKSSNGVKVSFEVFEPNSNYYFRVKVRK